MSEHTQNIEHSDHDEAHEMEHLRKHMKLYWGIFWALIVFTVITVLVSFVDLGADGIGAPDIVLGLVIATIKASLVAVFFMHLSDEKKLIYVILLFSTVFVIALFVLSIWAYYNKIEYL
ncbi:MAG: cytochrome C oxidase subunit IV family protein [Verrucomicrobiota bacterium]